MNRRRFALSLTGIAGGLLTGSGTAAPQASTAATPGRAQARLPPAIVTRIRVFYPPNYNAKQLTFVAAMTEGAPGITHRRPDGSLTHW